jgi:hypothetical protein
VLEEIGRDDSHDARLVGAGQGEDILGLGGHERVS